MPCLLLEDEGLVKTVNFKKPVYIGDPINSVRIYNELGVDELIFLDIKASINKTAPSFKIISEITSECFMPFSYGGGIRSLDDVKKLFDLGVEKIAINTIAFNQPEFISKTAAIYGSQSVIVAMDIKKSFLGNKYIFIMDGSKNTKVDPILYAKSIEELGAGEILLNSIDNDGLMTGFDLDIISQISHSVNIPVIALGGAGQLEDINKAKIAGASAIALGSMAVYQNQNKGILINFPSQGELISVLNEQ